MPASLPATSVDLNPRRYAQALARRWTYLNRQRTSRACMLTVRTSTHVASLRPEYRPEFRCAASTRNGLLTFVHPYMPSGAAPHWF